MLLPFAPLTFYNTFNVKNGNLSIDPSQTFFTVRTVVIHHNFLRTLFWQGVRYHKSGEDSYVTPGRLRHPHLKNDRKIVL
jgi:hypothetical protein